MAFTAQSAVKGYNLSWSCENIDGTNCDIRDEKNL